MNRNTDIHAEKILKGRMNFASFLHSRIKLETDESEIIRLASFAATYLTFFHSGMFCSPIIESRLCEIAESHGNNLDHIDYKDKSYIHVLTHAFLTGGHTRIVERWIENSSNSESHSVIVIKDKESYISDRLVNAVKSKNGDILTLDSQDNTIIDQALELRNLASRFQCVILHIDMNDVLPILAFGTTKFKRPVLFMNHADHIFWLGASISDVIIDISSFGKEITAGRRNCESVLVPIPIDSNDIQEKNNRNARAVVRKKLGIPETAKIITTIGSPSKFRPVNKTRNFFRLSEEITSSRNDVWIVAIGPTVHEKDWKRVQKSTCGKVLPIGRIPRQELNDYITASDLYLDPYPHGGASAILEVAILGISAVSIKTGITQFDSYKDFTYSYEDAISKILECLNDNKCNGDELKKSVLADHAIPKFKENIKNAIKCAPDIHNIKNLIADCSTNQYDLHLTNLTSNSYQISVRDFLKLRLVNQVRILFYFFINIKTKWKILVNGMIRISEKLQYKKREKII